jgi:TctA family transporter
LLFKRDKRALPIVKWASIFVGLFSLPMLPVSYICLKYEPNDYLALGIFALMFCGSAITYFFITRPKVKEQFFR